MNVRLSTPRKVYQSKTCRVREGRLMQMPRLYKERDRFGAYNVSSFRSILYRNGGWYLDAPYYAYAGEHRTRRLPGSLQWKITAIAICGEVIAAKRQAIIWGKRKMIGLRIALRRLNWFSAENRRRRAFAREIDCLFKAQGK